MKVLIWEQYLIKVFDNSVENNVFLLIYVVKILFLLLNRKIIQYQYDKIKKFNHFIMLPKTIKTQSGEAKQPSDDSQRRTVPTHQEWISLWR